MTVTLILVLASVNSAVAARIRHQEVKNQNENFKKWWESDLVWRFDDLPSSGMVPDFRVPYSGAIYPDTAGGTASVLRKYDRAFHGGRKLATSFEARDIEVTKERRRGRLFGIVRVNRTPHWAGHCNGWTAAAIRHAEPEKNVARGGVVFTPSDIKALLAELYTYTDIEHLGGMDAAVNPGIFHVAICNWLGRKKYPFGMDSSVGKEVWNYPVYAYSASTAKRGDRRVEVKLNLGYVHYTNREFDKGPDNYRYLYLHYLLELDSQGKIVGGSYYGDSNRLDMIWVPLMPTPGGSRGNEPGNPHLSVSTVLSLWRESASREVRKKWYTVDPARQDRVSWETAQKAIAEEEEAKKEAEQPSDASEQHRVTDEDEGREPEPTAEVARARASLAR